MLGRPPLLLLDSLVPKLHSYRRQSVPPTCGSVTTLPIGPTSPIWRSVATETISSSSSVKSCVFWMGWQRIRMLRNSRYASSDFGGQSAPGISHCGGVIWPTCGNPSAHWFRFYITMPLFYITQEAGRLLCGLPTSFLSGIELISVRGIAELSVLKAAVKFRILSPAHPSKRGRAELMRLQEFKSLVPGA
ncbi:hypothetical protein DFH08DRAFT_821939 [Mycena albidolilacea]|uniref:Uncharacterized protein n=1 Tax=Mycena albidolilacea TaxID=1033008 RepID=A0AAD6Z9Y9_9AGAR|nr:hypothetical protein DFH08DRAFT_821939 [Mycena albidolilacea]